MAKKNQIEKNILRVRNQLIWSLHRDGHNGEEIAKIFNMERTWMSRLIKAMPKDFKTMFVPVAK